MESGRSHEYLAEADGLTVAVKCYASGGENALHAHPLEDHTFVILQGEATYRNEAGEELVLGRHEGVLVPAGALMLRVGAASRVDSYERVGPDGERVEARSLPGR